MSGVNLTAKLATFSEHWQPRTVGQFNGSARASCSSCRRASSTGRSRATKRTCS